ncbi:MAG: SAM-dependent methyltransferase [Eubacteriales bacterium]
MEELRIRLEELLCEELIQITISNPRKGGCMKKIKIRPFLDKGQLVFQESKFIDTKVYHTNQNAPETISAILQYMQDSFKQMEIESKGMRDTVLVSKSGTVTMKRKKSEKYTAGCVDLSHNRKKKYILEEGVLVPFLVELGVQTREGKIVKEKYHKFRQMNRYLEFIEDIFPVLADKEIIQIIDFGCGKAYLTFAMYYYLVELQKKKVKIVGLDLKADVVTYCNTLKEKFGYEGLLFEIGSIEKYQVEHNVDMVVTLHACDTATDFALEKAVRWNAKVIMLVPCCQHEVNAQIQNEFLQPVLKYGIIKERISALMTDAIRANILEEYGYDAQILEFIDMEHTPKNLLIRGVRKGQRIQNTAVRQMAEELHITPTITKIL